MRLLSDNQQQNIYNPLKHYMSEQKFHSVLIRTIPGKPVIGKTLAHKNVNTTAIYARLNLDPVRESMDKATKAMLESMKKQ